MKILKLMGVLCAALFITLASCKKEDVDNSSDDPIFDCPQLEANYNDPCEIYIGNAIQAGTVSADCDCVSADTAEPDCPDFYFEGWSDGKVGSPCETPEVPMGGVISENCECVPGDVTTEADCPDFYFEGWSDGNVGSPCETPEVPMGGVISENCECVPSEGYCNEIQGANANYPNGFIGETCYTINDEPGIITDDCQCEAVELCDEVSNLASWYPLEFPNGVELSIGDPCWNSNDEQSTVNANCECE